MAYTLAVFERVLRERAAAVEPLLQEAARRLAVEALATSRQLLTSEIYDKPVDRRANGKPKWTRTGQLRRAERVEVRPGPSVVLVNDQAYAEPRHEANKPGRRVINVNRTAHWRDDTLTKLRGRPAELYRAAILRALSKGSL
jgi:hypothetical protein